jgi:hypothetical protein
VTRWWLGVARVMSPDVRFSHPWPSLTRCLRRFALQASLANNAGSMTRATPSWTRIEGGTWHGRQDGGRLGAGDLGLPPPSNDSAGGTAAPAESAWGRLAAP